MQTTSRVKLLLLQRQLELSYARFIDPNPQFVSIEAFKIRQGAIETFGKWLELLNNDTTDSTIIERIKKEISSKTNELAKSIFKISDYFSVKEITPQTLTLEQEGEIYGFFPSDGTVSGNASKAMISLSWLKRGLVLAKKNGDVSLLDLWEGKNILNEMKDMTRRRMLLRDLYADDSMDHYLAVQSILRNAKKEYEELKEQLQIDDTFCRLQRGNAAVRESYQNYIKANQTRKIDKEAYDRFEEAQSDAYDKALEDCESSGKFELEMLIEETKIKLECVMKRADIQEEEIANLTEEFPDIGEIKLTYQELNQALINNQIEYQRLEEGLDNAEKAWSIDMDGDNLLTGKNMDEYLKAYKMSYYAAEQAWDALMDTCKRESKEFSDLFIIYEKKKVSFEQKQTNFLATCKAFTDSDSNREAAKTTPNECHKKPHSPPTTIAQALEDIILPAVFVPLSARPFQHNDLSVMVASCDKELQYVLQHGKVFYYQHFNIGGETVTQR
ncbi:hypothetical protein K7432_003481 [Basidiobolus ranarum]|uniref:EF-hand domain-containing protein n=1 Tax=Basidiobolus ranarum TaxID=34480 RepID=A0ABR2W659_9FUNG